MGYCISTVDCTAVLPKENIPAAVIALKKLDRTGHKSGGSYQGGRKTESWFSWVATDWAQTSDIVKMFDEWRYETSWDEHGNLAVCYFNGEKYGDDDQFWATLAPYMTGSIEMRGEDDAQWKWVLGGKLETLNGRTVYDDPEGN